MPIFEHGEIGYEYESEFIHGREAVYGINSLFWTKTGEQVSKEEAEKEFIVLDVSDLQMILDQEANEE